MLRGSDTSSHSISKPGIKVIAWCESCCTKCQSLFERMRGLRWCLRSYGFRRHVTKKLIRFNNI
jgi:hypothetical protein